MCQYTDRCPTGRHITAACRYTKHKTSVVSSSSDLAVGSLMRNRRFRPVGISLGIDAFDFIAVIALMTFWNVNPERISTPFIVFAVFLVFLPLGLGVWLTRTCTVWNGGDYQRCQRVCYGLSRCGIPAHSRESGRLLTFPELVGILSWFLALYGAFALFGATT